MPLCRPLSFFVSISRLFTTDPTVDRAMFHTTRGVGSIILRTLFLSILHSRFSRFFFSLPATIFQRAVGHRFQFFFFAFVFLFLSSCSFVCSSHFFLSFFFSLLSLPFVFFSLSIFRVHRPCFGISLPRSPQAFLPLPAAVG